MKKCIWILAAAAVAAVACSKDENVTPEAARHTLKAYVEQLSGVTRTALEDVKVLWSTGDAVYVYSMDEDQSSKYTVTSESGGKSEAELETADTKFESGELVAFYPFDAVSSFDADADVFNVTLPATQSYAASSFGAGAAPMSGYAEDAAGGLEFKNLCGVLRLNVTGSSSIVKIIVKGNSGEIISGAATASPDYGSINMTGSGTSVTLDCGDGVALSAEGTEFNIVLPPTTFSSGFTVRVVSTEGYMDKKISSSQSIGRSQVVVMPAFAYADKVISSFITFTSEGTSTLSYNLNTAANVAAVSLEYSLDGGAWTAWKDSDADGKLDALSFSALRLRGSNPDGLPGNMIAQSSFVLTGDNVACSGNLMSLIDCLEPPVAIPSGSAGFSGLFKDCTTLTAAPELPATGLTANCYWQMFSGCTLLTAAPELPATDGVSGCYSGMFSGCTSLNYIKCLLSSSTTSAGGSCTSGWVDGVASSGTFVKSASAADWATGTSGIPEGWTVTEVTAE